MSFARGRPYGCHVALCGVCKERPVENADTPVFAWLKGPPTKTVEYREIHVLGWRSRVRV